MIWSFDTNDISFGPFLKALSSLFANLSGHSGLVWSALVLRPTFTFLCLYRNVIYFWLFDLLLFFNVPTLFGNLPGQEVISILFLSFDIVLPVSTCFNSKEILFSPSIQIIYHLAIFYWLYEGFWVICNKWYVYSFWLPFTEILFGPSTWSIDYIVTFFVIYLTRGDHNLVFRPSTYFYINRFYSAKWK